MEYISQPNIETIQSDRTKLEVSHTIFSHYNFKLAFAKAYSDMVFFALTTQSEKQLTSIIPLQYRDGIIEFWNSPRADYNEILGVTNIGDLSEVKGILKREFGNVEIKFKDMPKKYFQEVEYIQRKVYKLFINQSYNDSLNNNGIKKELSKKLRLCEEDGIKLNFKTLVEEVDITTLLPQLFKLHFQRRDNTNTPSQFHDYRNQQLYYELSKHKDLGCQINVLYDNDNIIAIHFGFYKNGQFYLYKSVYNTDYGKYSPGLLLKNFIVNSYIENGITVFDLLRGEEEYKIKLSNTHSFNYELI